MIILPKIWQIHQDTAVAPKIKGNIRINSSNSTDFARINSLKSEKFRRGVNKSEEFTTKCNLDHHHILNLPTKITL